MEVAMLFFQKRAESKLALPQHLTLHQTPKWLPQSLALKNRYSWRASPMYLLLVALLAFTVAVRHLRHASPSSSSLLSAEKSAYDSWSSRPPTSSSENFSRHSTSRTVAALCRIRRPGTTLIPGFLSCPLEAKKVDTLSARIDALAQDTVLTYKTGSSQLWDSLPLHLAVPRPDIPKRMFFSDAEANFGAHHVIDILANVSDAILAADEFEAYHSIHRSLRERIPMQKDFSHWKLDKFKTLPLIGEAYRTHPSAQWYVMLDGDTFVFWRSMLRWLSMQDARLPHVFGRQHGDGTYKWPHGGAGYVLSAGLMNATYAQDPWGFEHRWDAESLAIRGGDVILSHILAKSGAMPEEGTDGGEALFTSEPVRDLVFQEHSWLSPIFTLHHLTPAEVYELRQFEVKRLEQTGQDEFIRYCDLFDAFAPSFLTAALQLYMSGASPETNVVRRGWHASEGNAAVYPENFAITRKVPYDANLCETLCDENRSCFSWTFEDDAMPSRRRCVLSQGAWGFGKPEARFRSGWRIDRITHFQKQHQCNSMEARQVWDALHLSGTASYNSTEAK